MGNDGNAAVGENRFKDNIPASYRYNWSGTFTGLYDNNNSSWIRAQKLTELSNATKAIVISDGQSPGPHGLNSSAYRSVAAGDGEAIGPKKLQSTNAAHLPPHARGQGVPRHGRRRDADFQA